MSKRIVRLSLAALWLVGLASGRAPADAPPGWFEAGNAPDDYDFTRDTSTAASGRSSALIAAKPGVTSSGFGTLMQIIDADNYRGARWRMTGYLKTHDAARAQMWMRVDGPDKKVLAFDNMDSRPVRGTTGWTRYDIVLDVPMNSIDIAFGFLLAPGGGKVWADDFKFEKVDAAQPVTAPAVNTPVRSKEPMNGDFELESPSVLKADNVDVYDMFRAASHGGNRAPFRIATGSINFRPDLKYNLCGMRVVANSKLPDGNRLEWDLMVNVYLVNAMPVASIAVGSFTRAPKSSARVARAPIAGLTLQVDGSGEAATAKITGTPNGSNGVQGEIPESYALKFFDALDAGTPFSLNMTFSTGERETLAARSLGGIGYPNPHFIAHGANAPTRQCIRALVPAAEPLGKLIESPHLS